jgi:thiamine-phosphate pyrophosphorylase
MKLSDLDFYFVTDSSLSRKGVLSDIKNAVKAGCRIVQYREKYKTTRNMIEEAKKIKEICKGNSVFIVNDRVDVALVVNADGVHIGQDDMCIETARRILGKDKIIGISVGNLKEAIEAENLGADYIGLGPIFMTTTKKDAGRPCGIERIRKIRKQVKLPIVAVGGVNKDNVKSVIKAGADSVVAVSAILSSDDVLEEVSNFIRIIREVKLK